MLHQAIDFRDECAALFEILDPLSGADWSRETQFKHWTIDDVVAHLHIFNVAAGLSLTDESAFTGFMARFNAAMKRGDGHLKFTHAWLDGSRGRELLGRWREGYLEIAGQFAEADPKARVKWAGPEMSVRSSITARLMETWAHGQAVYDLLSKPCVPTERLKNIVVMGVNTFGWTFRNRGLEVPAEVPYLRLTAPSGEIWEWNGPGGDNVIEGQAVEFCQVVTQVRNIADTSLNVKGEVAARWMSMAQCFAGPPEDPPPPGTRFTQR